VVHRVCNSTSICCSDRAVVLRDLTLDRVQQWLESILVSRLTASGAVHRRQLGRHNRVAITQIAVCVGSERRLWRQHRTF
jgi:hypothetical protein